MKKATTTQILWVFKSLFLFLFILVSYAHSIEFQEYEKKIKTNYSVRSAVEKLPRKEIEEILRSFVASGRPNRAVGSPGHKEAEDFLEKKLQSFNGPRASFSKQNFEGGTNLIWEKKGITKPDEVIILAANFDTILKDPKSGKAMLKGEMPGADNNGSGVSILISMIEIYNKLDLPKTVKLVFLDNEEINAEGSKEFVKKISKEMGKDKVVGLINLMMLANDSKTGDKERKLNNMSIYVRPRDQQGNDLDVTFAKMITASGKTNYDMMDFALKENMSGDFFPATTQNFAILGIPAVTMTQNRDADLNPRYRTSNDFVETLNINTYTNVFRYVTSAVLAWNYDIVK